MFRNSYDDAVSTKTSMRQRYQSKTVCIAQYALTVDVWTQPLNKDCFKLPILEGTSITIEQMKQITRIRKDLAAINISLLLNFSAYYSLQGEFRD